MPTELLDYKKAELRVVANTDWERRYRIKPAFKEPETVKWIDEYVQEGDTFYDVGANIGGYTFIAASRGAAVYAFEPEAMNYGRLVQNLDLNKEIADRIYPLPMALWDRHEIVTMHMKLPAPGAALHKVTRNGATVAGMPFTQRMFTVQLDDLQTWGIPVPNHIKIDVDGGEVNVVHGGTLTLSSPQMRSVMVEIDHTHEETVEAITTAMKSADLHEAERWARGHTPPVAVWNHLFLRPQ